MSVESISWLCIALLGVLVIGLGFAVSMRRVAAKRAIGYDASPTDALHKAVRAHGNTVEYAPMLALLFYLLADGSGGKLWVVWVIALVTLSRFLVAYALLFGKDLSKPHPLRLLGSLGTWLGGLALCVEVALEALA